MAHGKNLQVHETIRTPCTLEVRAEHQLALLARESCDCIPGIEDTQPRPDELRPTDVRTCRIEPLLLNVVTYFLSQTYPPGSGITGGFGKREAIELRRDGQV